MTAWSSHLPRKRPRTRASAVTTPSTVFSGTAISAISTVSQNAWIAAGVVIEPHTKPRPCSNVRKKTIATGTSSSAARYASASTRSPIVARRSTTIGGLRRRGGEAPEPADREQHDEREREQHDGDRGGRRHGVRLDPPEDEHRRDLGLERQVAGDENDRAELADPPREAEGGAGQDRRHEVRQDDAPEDGRRARAERHRRLLHLAVELHEDRLHRAD